MIQACQQNISTEPPRTDQSQQQSSLPVSSTSSEEGIPVIPLGLTSFPLREPSIVPSLPLPLLTMKPEDVKPEQQLLSHLDLSPDFLSSLQNGPKGIPLGVSASSGRIASGDYYASSKQAPLPSQGNGFPLIRQSHTLKSPQQEPDCELKTNQSSTFGQSRKVSIMQLVQIRLYLQI